MIITGLDLSLCATGIATYADGWDIRTIAPPKGATGMRRLDWLSREICERLAPADLVVCEDIAFSRNGASHSEIVMLHGFIRRELWMDDRPLALVAATISEWEAPLRLNAMSSQTTRSAGARRSQISRDSQSRRRMPVAPFGGAIVRMSQPSA
jgi:hypothetical protein